MTAPTLIYAGLAAALLGLGLAAVALQRSALRRLIGVNVMGLGVFTALLFPGPLEAGAPDPVPQALVITGLVVAVAATALGLALIRRAGASQDAPDGG